MLKRRPGAVGRSVCLLPALIIRRGTNYYAKYFSRDVVDGIVVRGIWGFEGLDKRIYWGFAGWARGFFDSGLSGGLWAENPHLRIEMRGTRHQRLIVLNNQ